METLIVMLLWLGPPMVDRVADPSHDVWRSKTEARNLECTRMTQAQAHEQFPGVVPEPNARTRTLMDIDALACSRRVVELGERAPRDEAILTSLRKNVTAITDVAQAQAGADTVWLVDAFYPEPRVARKIAIAARTDLVERGLKVSDRVPLLAAGDLDVMRDLPPGAAYKLACKRYFAQKALGPNDAFLGIVLVDPRETQLHAGVCVRGEWSWVR